MLKSKITCNACGHSGLVPSDKYKHGTVLKCIACGEEIIFHKNIYFKPQAHFAYVDSKEFMHEQDAKAMDAMLKVPGLSIALKVMIKHSYDQFQRISHFGEHIKVTEKTCSYILDMTKYAAAVLNVDCPDVFIKQCPDARTYTTCAEHPLIVLNSGLVELLTDSELLAVIAHEIGHIKCGHVVYNMLQRFVDKFPDLFGIASMLLSGVKVAMLEWRRKSEFSCDRAAMLVTENKDVVISSLLKLAGGSASLMCMMDFGDFKAQHEEYIALISGKGQKMMNGATLIMREEPFSMVRAVELDKWKGLKE